MVQISKELAEELMDDVGELLQQNSNARNFRRYDIRCKEYEARIEVLKKAIQEHDETQYYPACNGKYVPCSKKRKM